VRFSSPAALVAISSAVTEMRSGGFFPIRCCSFVETCKNASGYITNGRKAASFVINSSPGCCFFHRLQRRKGVAGTLPPTPLRLG
jgi:nitrogenase molybdenum-iron protein alpha/beta subunit